MYARSTILSKGKSLSSPHRGDERGMSCVTVLWRSDLHPGKHVPSPNTGGEWASSGSLRSAEEKEWDDRLVGANGAGLRSRLSNSEGLRTGADPSLRCDERRNVGVKGVVGVKELAAAVDGERK